MMIKIKRYLKEMAKDIKEKIQKDAQDTHHELAGEEHIERIDRVIWYAEAGVITNIETISEIMAVYDNYVNETCESC